MPGRYLPDSTARQVGARLLQACALSALVACASCTREPLHVSPSPVDASYQPPPSTVINNNIDILFMVDNSAEMTSMQTKLVAALPTFMQALEALPMGLPSVQIAVVSSDMGAPSDVQSSIGCGATGDAGHFQVSPKGTCTATTLNDGAQYISDNASGTEKNFTAADPMGIATVLQCISFLGSYGCGFEHQLASIDRALGSDGNPSPANAPGFVRDGAYLAIVILTNEDDCSAPPDTHLYSLNGGHQDLTNPLGPIANFRCNQFGHLCSDHGGPLEKPPLTPPADASGPMPTLDLTNCESNDDDGLLIPVRTFVQHIKALKPDPDHQILVTAIAGPTTPYTVEWLPGSGPNTAERWPAMNHSCTGKNGDGSFADPGVRISQFVQAFGENGALTSICDSAYSPALTWLAGRFSDLMSANCIAGKTDGASCP